MFLVCYAILNVIVQVDGLIQVGNLVESVVTRARGRRAELVKGRTLKSHQAEKSKALAALHAEFKFEGPERIIYVDPDQDKLDNQTVDKSVRKVPDDPSKYLDNENNTGDREDQKIYNGDDAEEGEFPFMARVTVGRTFYNGRRVSYSMCGGSIISSRLILTAAHCVVVGRDKWNELSNPANIKVTVGDHTTGRQDTNEQEFRVEGLIVHEEYSSVSIANDIAIIVLAEDMEFGEGVAAIRIPGDGDEVLYEAGSHVTVAGWGVMETGAIADTLQRLVYVFSSSDYCKQFWTYRFMTIQDGMVCTHRMSTPEGSYAHIWNGDSGSALFVKNDDGIFTQLALVSWSSTLSQAPAPDVHTNVFYYRDWIREHMGALDTTYLQSLEAHYGVRPPDLVFTDLRHFLYRRTNVYTSKDYNIIAADVYIYGLAPNHFVQIYDGADIESDKMVAMLSFNNELRSTLFSSTNEGFTFVVQTSNKGDLSGSVTIIYKATEANQGLPPTNLICPNGFWACSDRLYCIRESEVCDNTRGVAGQCRDGSDEDLGCKEEEEEKNNAPDQEGWISVYPGKTSFTWDYSINSIAIQTSSYKGSWDTVSVKIDHSTANDPAWFEIRFGAFQVYIRVHNCTENDFGMDYPTASLSTSEYIVSFNEDYMSVKGNGEVLWNLDYKGNMAMDSCYNTVHGMLTRGMFKTKDTASKKYRIVTRPGNDRLDKKPEPEDTIDYSLFESVEFNDIPRDQSIYYDISKYPIQVITKREPLANTGLVIVMFTEDSEREFSWIEVHFYASAPFYYISKCTENVVFFELPDPDENGDRIWTFEISRTMVVLRCNGKEYGRVDTASSTVERECSTILGTAATRIKFPTLYDTASDKFRVLCLDNCYMKIDPWRPIDSSFVDFQWDTAELSLDLRTGYGKGSELVQLIGFYENEEKFNEFKYVVVYHGETHLWVWIKNCTEYWIPLEYPATRLDYNQYSFTFTFHEKYASVLGNGKVIWNFNFTGSIAMSMCLETVKMYYPFSFVYYDDDKEPMVEDRFRLFGRLYNDTMNKKPDPEFADFSQFDDKEFKAFPPNKSLTYDFIRTPLQLKTEVDLPAKSAISISLFASNSTRLGSVDIGFLQFAAFYKISNCNEGTILFEIPDPLPGSTSTRIWTVDPATDVIVLRCNGAEFGRVERGSGAVLRSCGELFGGDVSNISIAAPVPMLYKVLCYGNCATMEGEDPLDPVDPEEEEEEDPKHYFKLYQPLNQSHLGLLLASENGEQWNTVCRMGVGREEVDTLCRTMGYNTGILIEALTVDEFNEICQKTSYWLTEMRCQYNSSSPSNCTFTLYRHSPVPCIRGEQIAVICTDKPFQLTLNWFTTKVSRKGQAHFKCSASATRFGTDLGMKDNAEATILSRHNTGNFTVVAEQMLHRWRKGYWSKKENIDHIPAIDRCFVCLVQMSHSGNLDIALSPDCQTDKDVVLDELLLSLERNVLEIN